MADYHAPTPKVTTGAIRGSRKVHVGPRGVAMREIHLDPSSGEAPVRVYDTSGPYTDPEAVIDIAQGLREVRRDWIRARGDVEDVTQRAKFAPRTMASWGRTVRAASSLSPTSARPCCARVPA
jgi:phosphomethylpyrimidine synthase